MGKTLKKINWEKSEGKKEIGRESKTESPVESQNMIGTSSGRNRAKRK